MLWGQRSTWGHLGSQGSKGHFHQKWVVVVLRSPIHANEPSEYNGMLYRTSNRVLNNGIKLIILICMDGTSQYHHHPKMLLLQITWHGYVTHAYIYISLRPSIPFMESRSTWGHIRQQISCDCVQICFQIFFFCQHFIDLYLRHDLTDFDQIWSQVPVDHPIYVICPDWGQMSRRGHRCQKGHFH